ncbi:MAG: ATP synthase F1 subunit epsilon [Bilifractor sp.]|nr:ATP synthase F1 subunit epsilon [Lachnospiraceae bacterium]MDY2837483.1 ATP synthase F1 subunit epsilon [Bilifractor sp.]
MAEAKYYLRVIASDKAFFSGYVTSLKVPTIDGQEGFLAHHSQIMLAIVPGEIDFVTPDGKKVTAVCGNGSMIFANNRATILVDTCESPEEVDKRRAEEALERAKERLRQKQSLREYKMTQASMARALSRLKFKDKYIN